MKTVALLKKEDGSCEYLLEIVNLDNKVYAQLLSQCEYNKQEKVREQKALRKEIEKLENKVLALEDEIKVLKGEE